MRYIGAALAALILISAGFFLWNLKMDADSGPIETVHAGNNVLLVAEYPGNQTSQEYRVELSRNPDTGCFTDIDGNPLVMPLGSEVRGGDANLRVVTGSGVEFTIGDTIRGGGELWTDAESLKEWLGADSLPDDCGKPPWAMVYGKIRR